MEKSLELFISLVRQSTKFVTRDFYELESLQNIGNKNYEFANKTCQRLVEKYVENLSKYYPKLIFTTDDIANSVNHDNYVLIEVIDGLSNLAKSLPYFATVVTKMIKKDDKHVAEFSAMIMPGNNEIYYSMAGKGAWREKLNDSHFGMSKLRVSMVASKNKDSLMVGCSYANFDLAKKISSNIRIVGSDAILCSLVSAGKLDVAILKDNLLTNPAFHLFLKESGGLCCSVGNFQIATNPELQIVINKLL